MFVYIPLKSKITKLDTMILEFEIIEIKDLLIIL